MYCKCFSWNPLVHYLLKCYSKELGVYCEGVGWGDSDESFLRNTWSLSHRTGRWLSLSFMVCWVRELFSATDSLFILPPHPPVGSQSITGDLKRGRETQDQSSRIRQWRKKCKDRPRVWKFICAACWFVATHRETDVYGKLQEPLGW